MGLIQVQTDFTHGELSPLMRSRYDTSIYLKAAERMTNVLVLPQGPATRRFGITFDRNLNVNSNEYELFNFLSIEGSNFLLMLTDLELRIFNQDGTEHPSSPLTFPFSGDKLIKSEVKYAQTHDESLFVHPDLPPQALRFNATTNIFTTQVFSFKNDPTIDFQDVDYSSTDFSLSVLLPGEKGSITATTPVFGPVIGSEYIGGVFIYLGTDAASTLGLARITSVSSATVANVTIITEFNPGAKAGGASVGAPGADSILEKVAISTARGFPRSVTFYENRLVFGGTKSLPQTLFMSQISDYRDFSPGTGSPDDAIVATISSNQSSNINHIISDRSFQVFSQRGEFAPPQLEDSALTATSISIRQQSSIGSARQVDPVVLDGATFYVQTGGKSVMAFLYSDNSASYESIPSSTLSDHLISDVLDMTTLKGQLASDADFLFLVNGGTVKRIDETLPEGTLTAFQTLRSQNIQAWTPQITQNGKFKRVQSVGNTLFFIIEREINSQTVQYLEHADFDTLTDSNVIPPNIGPRTIIGGLSHLEGETVEIIADGFVVTPQVVVNSEVTVETAASVFEIGLDVKTEIKPMPVNVTSQNGPLLPVPKRLPRNFIDVLDTQGIEVNGVLVRNIIYSEDFIDGPLPLRSGLFEISNLDGWDRRQAPSITQNGPFKMTILGIGYEVEV